MDKDYLIKLSKKSLKQLAKIPIKDQQRINIAITKLAKNPKPSNSKKLQSYGKTWRIRVGNYRILYEVYDNKLEIIVIRIGHRKNVYKLK